VDVERAADMYGQGRSLRQIGAELGVHLSPGQQLQSAGLSRAEHKIAERPHRT
jgi:hypothetical protein